VKIKEITLLTRDDPVHAEHIIGNQIPLFRSATQQKLKQTGFPDVSVDILDVRSLEQDHGDKKRSTYLVQVELTRKTETETFDVLLIDTHNTPNSPTLQIVYAGMRSLHETVPGDHELGKVIPVTEYVAAAIQHMADVLFGHLACRV
jgi:hypothetical protein